MAANGAAGREALMGNKDKGHRNTKKAASRGLKEKRLAKKAKRAGGENAAHQSADKTFGR
jgi:hypothetical protein